LGKYRSFYLLLNNKNKNKIKISLNAEMSYVPPHKRPGFKPNAAPAQVVPRKRAHFKSDATGLPTHDLVVKLYNKNNNTTLKSARQIRKIALKSRKKAKSAIKKVHKKTRVVKSASPPNKRNRHTQKAKSR
jgi:hypothetical protein